MDVYAKEEYSGEQMKEIRIGLENKLDVKSYLDKDLSPEQMKEIRLNLEKQR